VHDNPDQCTAVAPRWVRRCESVEQGRRHRPRHVQVVEREQDAVGNPVEAPKRSLHPRQQQAAEQQLLSEDGVEQAQGDEDSVSDPVAGHERRKRVGLGDGGEVVAGWGRKRGGDETLSGEDQQGRNQHDPESAADASGFGAAR
jgi:hypothetical protein